MIQTRSWKIWRDITARKTRTILVTLSIFVGVLGVVTLTTLGEIITQQLEKDLNPREMAMLRLYVESPIGPALDISAQLDTLRSQPGVTRAEGQAVYGFKWKRPGESDFRTGELYAYSEPFQQIRLEPIRLIKGAYPVEGRNEIAIERRMAEKYDLTPGDSMLVEINGVGQQMMRIVGIVFQPYLYVGGGDGSSAAYAMYTDAQRIVRFTGFSSIYVRFENFTVAREQAGEFRRVVRNQTPYKIVFYLLDNPQNNVFLVGVRQFSHVLLIVSVMALVVASFLVTNVIGTVVAEQRQQIGAMKALGATRGDILYIYLGMAFVYGLLGTIPALVLGLFLGQRAAQSAAPLANTVLENTLPPLTVPLLGLGLGIGIPLLAAVVPVLYGSRISILEAITDQGIRATYGKGLMPRLVRWLHISLPIDHALNNIVQHKARLALTFMTLMLAAATFMGMFAVFYTLNGVVGKIQDKLNYQVQIDPSQLEALDLMQQLYMNEQIREIQPGVAIELEADLPVNEDQFVEPGTAPVMSAPQTATLYVTGIDTQTDLLNVILSEGTAWNDDPNRAGIVITPDMASKFEKTIGDSLHLISPNAQADFEVIGIAEFPIETAFMEWHQLADFVGDLLDGPVPNAYWEQIQIKAESGDSLAMWAVGIDERFGKYLVPTFTADVPGVIVSQAVADAGGFQAGDTITLQPDNGDGSLLDVLGSDHSATYPILAVVEVKADQLRLVSRDVPPEVLAADTPEIVALYWAELASLVNLNYNDFLPTTFYVDLANPEASLNGGAFSVPTAVFRNQVSFTDRIVQTMLSIGLVMSVASSLMAVVGGIGLLTITSINVFERQREIGVMRSVGATSGVILRQFLLEGLLTGFSAWLVGVPVSYLLGQILIREIPFKDVVTFSYTRWAAVIGLVGMLGVTTAATLYPAITASRKTISDILRYQ